MTGTSTLTIKIDVEKDNKIEDSSSSIFAWNNHDETSDTEIDTIYVKDFHD